MVATLIMVDIDSRHATRATVDAVNPTEKAFPLRFHTWHDTKVYCIGAKGKLSLFAQLQC